MADNKRQEFKARARECVQSLHGLMVEAKNAGYHIQVASSLNTSGEPESKIAVLSR
jgi:hypothetical protein